MNRTKKVLLVLSLFCISLGVIACSDFERSTFQTLSASKAVIDTAQADYEARTIPHNACSYTIINDAKAVQITAVNAMVVYENEKAAKIDLAAQTQVVTDTLLKLPAIIVQVKSLYTNPNCGGSK